MTQNIKKEAVDGEQRNLPDNPETEKEKLDSLLACILLAACKSKLIWQKWKEIDIFGSLYFTQLKKSCFPSGSIDTRMKSLATAVDLQHNLKGVQGGAQE